MADLGILEVIGSSEGLCWGEFYPESALLKKTKLNTHGRFAEEFGIDFLALPPRGRDEKDLF